MTPRDLIEAARLRVWNRHPYIGAVLMSLRLVEMPGIGTLAVDSGWRLYYDPVQCEKWGVELLAGVVAHECWHVLRDHFTRMPPPAYEKQLSNIAMDLEINSDITKAGWKLPAGGCMPGKFKLAEGLLAEEYYKLLQPLVVSIKVGVCHGKCGGAAGNPHDFEVGADAATAAGVKPIDRLDQEVRRRQAAQDTVAAKSQGDVPAGLAAWAERELQSPTIDWRRQLAGLVRRAITHAAGAVDHTYRKQSRRGAGLRAVFGASYPILPALYCPVPSVALILDVSGSMDGGPAAAARAEIMGVVRAVGCPVEVFVADTRVAGKARVASAADIAKLGESLGGTDMAAAIREVAAMRRHDVLVVLTDGDTGWHAPGEVREAVLAAITPGGVMPPEWIRSVVMR